jgi:hypothetical protein
MRSGWLGARSWRRQVGSRRCAVVGTLKIIKVLQALCVWFNAQGKV